MEIIRCPQGHFYDADKNATCPACANEGQDFSLGGGNIGQTAPTYPATEPITGGSFTPPAGANGSMMDTQAFVDHGEKNVDSIVKTEPVDNPQGGANKNNKIDDYNATIPLGFKPGGNETNGGTASVPGDPFISHIQSFNPVTGWLVCVKGASKGTDYRIRSQYNYIGRGKHMDICISGDEYISTEKAAILAYDEMERKFFIAPGMGHNLIRLNDKMVMGSELLNPYDKITIGKTTLLFVPLCGEQFDWAEC